jgi:subtilisin family serine protease
MIYWMQGAEWADSLGADLLTSSLGYSTFDNPGDNYTIGDLDGHTTIVSRAAQIAASKGILVVNSAGNEGNNPSWRKITAPADVHGDSLIAAGAVSLAGTRAGFSSAGPTADGRIKPDLMALGVSVPIISTTLPTGYTSGDGTSFAAPIVAGLAASLLEARPSWTPSQVIRAMRETADQWLQPDTLYGYGVPNGDAALRWPESVVNVPPPASFPEIALAGPNPFRSDGPPARVQFALHRTAGSVERGLVRVHDLQGRVVRELWSGLLHAGEWVTVAWDGRSEASQPVNAGIYFISLETAGYMRAVRLALLP